MTDGNILLIEPPAKRTDTYAELKSRIKKAGLLKRQPLFYTQKIVLLIVLLSISVLALLLVKSFWLQLLNAVFLAFVTTQLGLLGHDADHRQIFAKSWQNDIVSLTTGNLLIGISHEWWMSRHNKHHSNPNQHDVDPDVHIPIIAFAPEDLYGRGKLIQNFMQYQAYFFFPVLTLALISMQADSIQFLLKEKIKYPIIERVFVIVHMVAYLTLIFTHLSLWQGLIFIFVHQIISGVYMGSVFAPNHKGMPVLNKEDNSSFLHRQILTARNVYAHPITDFWFGGLNYQIEHHLFPSMPRNNLRAAQIIVKEFCQENNISYYETDMVQSYRETLVFLHEVSAPLRKTAVA